VLPLGLLAVGFLAPALPPHLTLDPAAAPVPIPAGLPHFYPMLVVHIGFGAVALLTSVAQVWPWLRRRHPRGTVWITVDLGPGRYADLRLGGKDQS